MWYRASGDDEPAARLRERGLRHPDDHDRQLYLRVRRHAAIREERPDELWLGAAVDDDDLARRDARRMGGGNGMEWNGMEWGLGGGNGMEWNGIEWNGMEYTVDDDDLTRRDARRLGGGNGMEWNGTEWNGPEWNGGWEEVM